MGKRFRANREITRQALAMFEHATRLVAQELPPVAEAGFVPDVVITVTADNKTWRFPAVVKANINPASIGAAIGHLAPLLPKGLLLTGYVTPNMAEELREKGVQFLDTTGNAYLNAPPLFVFVKGNRPAVAMGSEKMKRAFRPSGLQVLFTLLLRPVLAMAPYREIAAVADVALGTVNWVMRDLKELGFLIDMGTRGRRLTRKTELFDHWVMRYPEQLRPKLAAGRFRATNPNWQEDAGDLAMFGAYWGGEQAAARMTGLLKPHTTTVYIREDPNAFILHNKLRKDPQGDIEILKAFWSEAMQQEHGDLTPPLLVYADLLATADPRNIEIAKVLYKQEINGLVRED